MANRKVIANRENVKVQPARPSKVKLLPKFQVATKDQELQKFQEDIRTMLMELFAESPFLNGKIVTAEFTDASLVVQLEHKLGRPAKGFVPLKVSKVKTDAGLYPSFIEVDPFGETPGTETALGDGVGKVGARADTHIIIYSDAACVATFWVW